MKNAVELGRAQRPALPGPGDTLQGAGLPCGALDRRRGGGAGDRGGLTALATWPRTAGPSARSVVPFVALVTRVTKVPSPFSTCTESPNVSAPTGSKVRPTSPQGGSGSSPHPPCASSLHLRPPHRTVAENNQVRRRRHSESCWHIRVPLGSRSAISSSSCLNQLKRFLLLPTNNIFVTS